MHSIYVSESHLKYKRQFHEENTYDFIFGSKYILSQKGT
jgi:hypothetical protein